MNHLKPPRSAWHHELEQHYGFRIDEIIRFGHTSGNENYKLCTDEGMFVLSVIEEQHVDEVRVMAELLKWLEQYNYFTSTLKRRLDGENTVLLSGKPAFVRTFLTGETKRVLSTPHVFQIGQALAALHRLPVPSFVPSTPYYEQAKFATATMSHLDADYERWLSAQETQYAQRERKHLRQCLIHADVFWDNVLFDGEQLIALIDFELACRYDRIFDLGMALVGTCIVNNQVQWSLATQLLRGYETVATLLPEEKQLLLAVSSYAAALTSKWRYWRYRCHGKNHPLAHSYQQMVELAKQLDEASAIFLVST